MLKKLIIDFTPAIFPRLIDSITINISTIHA